MYLKGLSSLGLQSLTWGKGKIVLGNSWRLSAQQLHPLAPPIASSALESQSCPLLCVMVLTYCLKYIQKWIIPHLPTTTMMVWATIILHLYYCNWPLISLFPPRFSRVCIQNSSRSDSFGNASYITYPINPLLKPTLHRLPLHWVKSKVLTLTCENLCDLPLCHWAPATSWLLPLLRPKLEIFLPSQPYIK